jgi:hypothetical protein
MKRLPVLLCALLLGGCGTMQGWVARAPAPQPVVSAPKAPQIASDGTPLVNIDGVAIEKVEFKPGVSSVTVERMAKQAGCSGGVGAGLVTQQGPVEVYRMACDNGKVFLARCEFRQCKPM